VLDTHTKSVVRYNFENDDRSEADC
jgi:hypothetical protein